MPAPSRSPLTNFKFSIFDCAPSHIHLDAVFSALVGKHPAHPFVAFLELYLFDPALFALDGGIGVQRDKLTGLIAGIVMLVPGTGRRRDHRAFMPVVALRLLAFLPHQRVARGIEQKDMGARTMPMRFLVS